MMASHHVLSVATHNVASLKSAKATFAAFDHFRRARQQVIFIQETHLDTLADLHRVKREWRWGPSFFSLATERYEGVAILFQDVEVTFQRVVELRKGRCVVLDVSLAGQPLRLINIYGPQSKWERKCLFSEIEPFLYTSKAILFGGDFNTVTRPKDRGGAKGRLRYDSLFLNKMVSQAGLVDVHIQHVPGLTGFTFHRGQSSSRIDRFFVKEGFPATAPVLTPVEFSDHLVLSCELNVTKSPERGRGIWRLNSDLLTDARVKQTFETFLADQMTLEDVCSSKSEWWEIVKARARTLFRSLAVNAQNSKYKIYLGLMRKLDRLVSQGGDSGEISEVRSLMKEFQYDRYASLVRERDHGSYHSPDPFLSCKRKEGTKVISGLRDTSGVLRDSSRGIQDVVRSYYLELLGKQRARPDQVESFLSDIDPHPDLEASLSEELIGPITVAEVEGAIASQNKCKAPGPDGLTAEFYQCFSALLAPHLAEVFNESLNGGLLPPTFRTSAVILLTKPGVVDTADVGNWRPISLLNVDRKILARVLFLRLQVLSEGLLSDSQFCTVRGRNVFDAVLEVREAVDRCRAGDWTGYILALDQSKAFDRVDHHYLWAVLRRYGLPAKFINWLITLYRGAESFALVNGWKGRPFRVLAGVRQGCPLSPLLYAFAIDPFLRRLGAGRFRGVDRGPATAPLRVVAYADDVSIVVSDPSEAALVVDLVSRYSSASSSQINRIKSGVFWCGKEGEEFPLPDGFPPPQSEIKILGIRFSRGDNALRNWTERLAIASGKITEAHRWKLSQTERVRLIKTYILPIFGYVSVVFLLPKSLHTRLLGMFFLMLWGNRLNLIRREITYLSRKDGGLAMVNPVVFFTIAFLKRNFGGLLMDDPPGWVHGFRVWVSPFLAEWFHGGIVKSTRVRHSAYLPTSVLEAVGMMRRWGITVEEVRDTPRKVVESRVLASNYSASLVLKDCPPRTLSSGLRNLNSRRIPPKFRDVAFLSFHGRLYVRGNLKHMNIADRVCPRAECSETVESMDHFLLECPFNLTVCREVSAALGIPCLSRQTYAEWVYGTSNSGGQRFHLGTLFLVSAVTRYYTWNARCQVSLRQKVLPCQVVVHNILAAVAGLCASERASLDASYWQKFWRNVKVRPP
uniref:Reverse transcriptase domain-containing protein n=1 Tax=Leptobrachium leishanense TaxID=445787 RepID=A0A8C5M5U5_9ANUR